MADRDFDGEDLASAKRREALKSLAKYGAYTAPVMLGLLTASKAVAASTGGGACCWVGSYLASGQKVGETSVGAPLRMMTPDGLGTQGGAVERVRWPVPQPCRTFATVTGITLALTDSTPVPVRRRGLLEYLRAIDVIEGDIVPVEDVGGFRWEPLADIAPRAPLPVGYISAGDGVYAAGDQPDRVIYTHNVSIF